MGTRAAKKLEKEVPAQISASIFLKWLKISALVA
jgi:hypothetical protein